MLDPMDSKNIWILWILRIHGILFLFKRNGWGGRKEERGSGKGEGEGGREGEGERKQTLAHPKNFSKPHPITI